MVGKRNFGLDLVRAFAISCVIFIHIISNTFKIDLGIWWYLAYLGVDIFFALSGFLIGGILIRMCTVSDKLTVSQTRFFLIRRWFRTVPLYIAMLFVNFLFSKYLFKNIESIDWKYFFWLQGFTKSPPSFFGESWTLCIEEWFYFSFSLGLCFFTLLTVKWRIAIKYKILLFTLFYILLFTLIRIIFSNYSLTDFTITIFRLDSIGYGVLLALLYYCFERRIKKCWLAILGLGLSLVGILLFLSHSKVGHLYMLYYSLTGLGLGICVLWFKLASDWFKRIFLNKVIEFISRISYSLYLVNLIVIYICLYLFRNQIQTLLLDFVILFFTILFSFITYNIIEKPFLRMRDKYFKG